MVAVNGLATKRSIVAEVVTPVEIFAAREPRTTSLELDVEKAEFIPPTKDLI